MSGAEVRAMIDLNEQELRKLTLLQANVRGHLARKKAAESAASRHEDAAVGSMPLVRFALPIAGRDEQWLELIHTTTIAAGNEGLSVCGAAGARCRGAPRPGGVWSRGQAADRSSAGQRPRLHIAQANTKAARHRAARSHAQPAGKPSGGI